MKNPIRDYIEKLNVEMLWTLYWQMDQYEQTGVVPENAELRKVAMHLQTHMEAIGREVWHALIAKKLLSAV